MRRKEPFIGITCDFHCPKDKKPPFYELTCDHRYPEAVKHAGGYPILLPIALRQSVIRRYLDEINGIIIVGGDDVDPRLYGEKKKKGTGTVLRPRLFFECQMYLEARKRKLPVFGVCYGMQLINVLEGGSLFQDIRRDAKSPLNHRNKRSPETLVTVDPQSRLGKIIGKKKISVHCEHHQAVSRVAPNFKPVAFSPDGIIGAIESRSKEIVAVQWHPERTLFSLVSQRIFKTFVQICQKNRFKRNKK